MRMLVMLMCASTNRIALPLVVSGARVLSICLLGIAFSASCRKQTVDKPEPPSRRMIEALDPLFLVPGHEKEIYPDYGLPMVNEVAVSVGYNLGAGDSTTVFLKALEQHLRALGWSTPEFTFSNPPERASEAATWRHPPTAEPSIRMLTQWWVQGDEVVVVSGIRDENPNGGCVPPTRVHIVITRYLPAEARRMLREYEQLHGTLPTMGHTNAPVPLENSPTVPAEDP